MIENLSAIVASMRKELNQLTRLYIDRQHEETTALMVQSQRLSKQIDNLESFIIDRHDDRCLAILRKKMSQYFSVDETFSIVHDIGISDFNWHGVNVSSMHADLITFCQRRELLPILIAELRLLRPRVLWPDC